MSDKDFIEQIDKIGQRLTGALILSVISLIWLYEYAFAWKAFGTILFLLMLCVSISVYKNNRK